MILLKNRRWVNQTERDKKCEIKETNNEGNKDWRRIMLMVVGDEE